MAKAIGLDFGTTNSALALATSDGVVQLARFRGKETFRSILYFDEHDAARSGKLRVVAGPDAIQSYLNAKTPGRLIQSMKSYLASRLFNQTQILGETYALEELIGILLRHLRKFAEERFGNLGSTLVVGRPVHFSGTKNEADDKFAVNRLRTAFSNAGFENVHFLPEPVAAAYKYQQRLDHDELVLIADFGGGTSDFSLLRVGPGVRSAGDRARALLGNDGVPLAGDAFDGRLVRHLVAPLLGRGAEFRSVFDRVLPIPSWIYAHLERWHHLSFLRSPRTLQLLLDLRREALEPEKLAALLHLVEHDLGFLLFRAVERAKRELSEQDAARFRFEHEDLCIDRPVTRAQFEAWIAPELLAIAGCVDGLLRRARVPAAAVDRVFLTGGSSLVPAVRRLFEERFGSEKLRSGGELTSVASGLALRAASAARA